MPFSPRQCRLAGAAVLLPAFAQAAPGLVVNGGFETAPAGDTQITGANLPGWSDVGGFGFLFSPATVSTTGSSGPYGNLSLWGPGNGSANGLGASPTGGNFVGLDGAFMPAPLTQTLNGLKVGDVYAVNFAWGGAQQYGFTGPTTEQFVVGLGTQTHSTAVLPNPSHGFTGWLSQTFDYTATSTSEVLSFLAVGTPSGVPPFSVLDGVSATDISTVPEPATLGLLAVGMVGVGVATRRRSR